MSTFEILIIILLIVLILLVIWVLTEISSIKKVEAKIESTNPDTQKLRLQAYERLALLAERISLTSTLSRSKNFDFSIKEMKSALIEDIKHEYEYNISQQIYVSPEIWKAVTNFKEQNIYIINEIAASLPPQATGLDLNKQIIDFLINNPKSSMGEMVLEAINFDAKKLM